MARYGATARRFRFGATVIACEVVLVPVPSPTSSVTVYVPGARNVCLGCCHEDVCPSPNVHFQLVTLPREASMNHIGRPATMATPE